MEKRGFDTLWKEAVERSRHPPHPLRGQLRGSPAAGWPCPELAAVLRHCRLMARLDLKEKKKKSLSEEAIAMTFLETLHSLGFFFSPPSPPPPGFCTLLAARGFGPNTSLEGAKWYPGCGSAWTNGDGRCFPGGRTPLDRHHRGENITLATPPASSGYCLLSGSWSGAGGTHTHTTGRRRKIRSR